MRRFRRTTLITVACFAVLAGIGLSRKTSLELAGSLLIFLPLLLRLKNRDILSLIIAVMLGLGLGLWRGGIYMQKLGQIKELAGDKVVMEAVATSDSIYAPKSQLQFTVTEVRIVSPNAGELAGSYKISGFGPPMVYRGDRLRISGKLFISRGANQAGISYAQIETLSKADNRLYSFGRSFTTGMQNALPEPQASFALGLLVGQRSNLPQEILKQLTMVGLVHIVAVSGYNLTIIVRAMQKLKINSKYQRTILSFGLILVFLVMTGFSASIVRAAVISVLSLWAIYYGRSIRPILLIALAAALTGIANPFYVWSDIGWYLSFLAFFGVLMIAPAVIARFFKKQPSLLTQVVVETLCAEVMTLPLIMLIFGQMSLVALLANAVVVPLIPAAMLFSAIAGLAGAIAPQLAGWLALPAQVLLTFILDVIHLFASIPSIFLRAYLSPTLAIGVYIFILGFVIVLNHRVKAKKATEPVAITP